MSEKGEKDVKSRREMLKTAGALAVGLAVLPAAKAVAAEEVKAPRWAMVIDLRKCIGCRGCTVSCKSENNVPLGRWNTVVKQIESGKYPDARKDFLPRLCNHCEGDEKDKVPPCVKICPEYPKKRQTFITPDGKKIAYRDGATYKRPDGAILIDNAACTGCGKCIKECPYGSRYFDPLVKSGQDSTKNAIGKCTFCMHRVEKGLLPACVNTCQGGARIFGDLNDPESDVSRLVKEFNLVANRKETTLEETLLPKKKTNPNVFYIDPKKVLKGYKIDKKIKEAEFSDHIV